MKKSSTREIWRWQIKHPLDRARDEVAREEPLEIRLQGRGISVTMRTPGHDEELAAGFLLTEGLIKNRQDLERTEHSMRNRFGNVINVAVSPQVSIDFEKLTRHVFASSSCGLCGKVSIDLVHQFFEQVESEVVIDGATLLLLPDRLRQAQETFERTGGLHAAAIFDANGNLLVLREDVGRHNAVDKVVGYGLLKGLLPFDRHILMVSGRASFEIMQKALAARIPVVAAVSAPSSLAIDFAVESRQTLVGFLRGQGMNIYSRPERIRFADL